MISKEFSCDCNILHSDAVKETVAKMPDSTVFDRLSDFYKILGDSTRCKIIFALSKNELCVCDLANVLSMTKSSVSHQLAKMRNYGVVKCRKDGKTVFYSLDDDHISTIFESTLEHINHKAGNIK